MKKAALHPWSTARLVAEVAGLRIPRFHDCFPLGIGIWLGDPGILVEAFDRHCVVKIYLAWVMVPGDWSGTCVRGGACERNVTLSGE